MSTAKPCPALRSCSFLQMPSRSMQTGWQGAPVLHRILVQKKLNSGSTKLSSEFNFLSSSRHGQRFPPPQVQFNLLHSPNVPIRFRRNLLSRQDGSDFSAPSASQPTLFKKSSKLNNVLYDVRGPVVDEAERMESSGVQILKLNIGNPAPFGFRTPDEVIYDMRQQLTECEGYSPAKGLFAARKAIMQYAQLKKYPQRHHRGYLHGKRCQRADQFKHVRPAGRRG